MYRNTKHMQIKIYADFPNSNHHKRRVRMLNSQS